MVDLLTVLALGFFLGMRHATDADHIIAVSTIVTRQSKISRSALVGALWGVGHTLTIVLIGSVIIVLGIVIPARVGLTMELSVALMLMALGIWNLGSFFQAANAIAADHAQHGHPHGSFHLHHAENESGARELTRPLLVGIVHGMAGSAAIALLVLATIHNAAWAVAYLLIFGVGTILGMVLMTSALGSAIAFGQRKALRFERGLRVATGLISLAFGIVVAYQIGYLGGLFTAHPHWTPK
jgi:high-affinity nickel-transport protein